MRRLFPTLAVSLLLSACGDASVAYQLTFGVDDQDDQQALIEASLRVIERRLDRMEESILDKHVERDGSGSTLLSLTMTHQDAADTLTEELTRPFKLRIMAQTETGGDLFVDGIGSFRETGITEEDLLWVQSRQRPDSNRGEVRLIFTPDGQPRMEELYRSMYQKNLGLFVRDRLISLMQVEQKELTDDIVIRDIPDPAMAGIFADDVNVGLHVTFTPVH